MQGGEAAGVGAESDELNVFIRVDAVFGENHSRQHVSGVAEAGESDSFAGKLFDRFDFRAGEENMGGAAHQAGDDARRAGREWRRESPNR